MPRGATGHGPTTVVLCSWAKRQQKRYLVPRKEMFFMDHNLTHSILNRIAFIGNYLPRLCGIATFTTDLCGSIAAQYFGFEKEAVFIYG